MTYALEGMAIKPSTGVLSFTPIASQAPARYDVTVFATDNGLPAMTASRAFTVVSETVPMRDLDLVVDLDPRAGDWVTRVQAGTSGDYVFLPDGDGGVTLGVTRDSSGVTTIAGFPSAYLLSECVLRDRIYFVVGGSAGDRLWTSDGTSAGTRVLRDFGFRNPYGNQMMGLGPELIFTANDPEHGQEVWHSDGSPQGTELLEDLDPGPTNSFPAFFQYVSGRVYFTSIEYQGVPQARLWVTDGSTDGTVLVSSFAEARPAVSPFGVVASVHRPPPHSSI